MLEFLAKKRALSNGFVLDIFLNDDSQLLRTSLHNHDAIGLVVQDNEGEIRLLPWNSIQSIIFEEL